MNRIIILAIAFASVSTAPARIYESPEKCAERYGTPFAKNEANQTVSFLKNGFSILVFFHEQRAAALRFKRNTTKYSRLQLTETEIQTLLRANGGEYWTPDEDGTTWHSENNNIHATYDGTEGALLIYTTDFLKNHAALRKTEEQKNLEGF